MIPSLLGFDGQRLGLESCESTGNALLSINARHISAAAEHDAEVISVSFAVPETHPVLSALSCTDVSCVELLPVKAQICIGFLFLGLVSPGTCLSISCLWYGDITYPGLILAARVDRSSRNESQELSMS